MDEAQRFSLLRKRSVGLFIDEPPEKLIEVAALLSEKIQTARFLPTIALTDYVFMS